MTGCQLTYLAGLSTESPTPPGSDNYDGSALVYKFEWCPAWEVPQPVASHSEALRDSFACDCDVWRWVEDWEEEDPRNH